ncbi:MAG: hypothetical protein KAZ26_21440 [Caldilineaceae bacterium]|nr:hypothetical protein [Caldilineaceae bacterium]MBP8125225.1 hypothetical protein [Caldilineaceae bacterium]
MSPTLSPLPLILAFALGCLVTAVWTSAVARWQRGRGLIRRPGVVEFENEERMWKAKGDRARGCREMLRSVLGFGLVGMLTFVLGLLFRAVV